jgi:hypothetical protein
MERANRKIFAKGCFLFLLAYFSITFGGVCGYAYIFRDSLSKWSALLHDKKGRISSHILQTKIFAYFPALTETGAGCDPDEKRTTPRVDDVNCRSCSACRIRLFRRVLLLPCSLYVAHRPRRVRVSLRARAPLSSLTAVSGG